MKLFKKLASIYSGSGKEQPMAAYIKRWVASSAPSAKITEDENGNIYIRKGMSDTYPCVVAHLDQVQKPYPKDYKVIESKDIIFAFSPSKRSRCGLGADDKCGIWIALKMLQKHDAIKVVFFPGEEIGCVGSSKANMDFFSDVRFVIEPDRRGAYDLITSINGKICSDKFVKAITPEAFGYSETEGMMTDVETLKERGLEVSCINLSCGYYEPHTENEFVMKADMLNCLEFVDHIITDCTDTFPHKYVPDYSSWGYFTTPKSKRKGKSKEVDMWQQYYDQKEEAYATIEQGVLEGAYISAEAFMADYEGVWPMLTAEDFYELFDDAQYAKQWADEGDEGKQYLDNQISDLYPTTSRHDFKI